MSNEESAERVNRGSESASDEAGPTALDLLVVVAKHKKMIFGLTVAASIISAILAVLMPNIYTATARLLPPQQNQSAAASALSQLGALTGFSQAGLGVKNPNEIYIGILKSRSVADSLIQRFELQKVYDKITATDTRLALESATQISVSKEGLIGIEVSDKNAKLAAALANAYIEELQKLTQTLALTEASQRRLFFENQLRLSKEALQNAELGLQRTQEKTGVIKLEEQGRTIIETIARLRAQVAAKEVQLAAMRTFATENNPDLVVAQRELAGLRVQLLKLEQNQPHVKGDVLVPTQKVPEVGLEYLRSVRDVKYHETMFELIAKQFEAAKIDEAKNAALIQVLDRAVEPEKKSAPHRRNIVVLSTVIVFFLAVLLAFALEFLLTSLRDDAQRQRIQRLRQYLAWR
jgi:tyrosine-protein kinase Etk/Wzc